MKQKIKDALKQKYTNTGLSAEVMDGVASILAGNVTEEEQIETAVSGAEPLLKSVQSSLDRERQERSKAEKRVKELESEQDEPKKPNEEQERKEPEDKLASLEALLLAQQEEITRMKSERTQSTFLSELTKLFSEKKVPESYYKPIVSGRTFGEDFDPSTYAEEVSQSYLALQKDLVNERFKDVEAPNRGQEGGTGDDDPLAKMISKGTEEIKKQ